MTTEPPKKQQKVIGEYNGIDKSSNSYPLVAWRFDVEKTIKICDEWAPAKHIKEDKVYYFDEIFKVSEQWNDIFDYDARSILISMDGDTELYSDVNDNINMAMQVIWNRLLSKGFCKCDVVSSKNYVLQLYLRKIEIF